MNPTYEERARAGEALPMVLLSQADAEIERLREALEAFAVDRWGTTNPILVTDADKPLQEIYFRAVPA